MSEIPHIQPSTIRRYMDLNTGYVTDGLRLLGLGGWMEDVYPLKPGSKFCGRARTMVFAPRSGEKKLKDNNYSVIRSLDPGDVLVMVTGGATSFMFGENVGQHAIHQRLGGLVTDSRVRDAAALRESGLPVYCKGISARPHALDLIALDVPVACSGALVTPGDLLIGDDDGALVVPGAQAAAVLVEAEHVRNVEMEQGEAIAVGRPIEEIQKIIRKKKLRSKDLEAAN